MSSTSLLASFSTCELSDALIKLSIPHGGYIPDINMLSPATPASSSTPTRICSPAYTVQIVLASNNTAPKLAEHFVDTAPKDSVIVVDVPPEAKNAVWGGLMSAGAQARGATGVIISGRCRDLSEHRALGFPVFARDHSTLGQSPFTRPSEVNVALSIRPQGHVYGGTGLGRLGEGEDVFPAVTVNPGDWIVADEDGVVCVPKELEEKVVEVATKGREVDARCIEDIKAGNGVQASFKLHRGK